jgi:hypothetical protein
MDSLRKDGVMLGSRSYRFGFAATVALTGLMAVAAPGYANRVHTGGDTGAYYRDFCPALAREMAALGSNYVCTTSSGTRENMERVLATPREFGYGQLDVFALESGQLSARRALELVRQDDARECVFAVTKNKDITSYGELAAMASQLRFTLPPQSSGSAGTFQYLRFLDGNGLGRATRISHAANADEAIRAALSRDDGVTVFVQFPDPDNERFKLVRDLGGHFVPVIDKPILTQQIGGQNVYYAQETRVANARLSNLGGRVTTACTPLVLFTGNSERIRSEAERRTHTDLVGSVRRLPLDVLVPRESPMRSFAQRTRELTAEGRERLMAYSSRARDRALPFIERMIERATPRY